MRRIVYSASAATRAGSPFHGSTLCRLNFDSHRSLSTSLVLQAAKAGSAVEATKETKVKKAKQEKTNAESTLVTKQKEKKEKVAKAKETKPKKAKKETNAAVSAIEQAATGEEVARFLHGVEREGHVSAALAHAGMPQEDQMQLKGFVDALEKIGKTRPADKPWGVFKIQDDGQVEPLGLFRTEQEANVAFGDDQEPATKPKEEKKEKSADGENQKSRKEKRDEKKAKEKVKKEEKAKKAEDKKLAKVAAKETKADKPKSTKKGSKKAETASGKEEELK